MIFNFLGSNHSSSFAWRFLIAKKTPGAEDELRHLLTEKYSGQAFLYYRGRAALTEAVRLCGADYVLVNGFTCYVVEQAVCAGGSRPFFTDISRKTYNFTVEHLEKAHRQQPRIGAVIIQNTFGIGDEIKPIVNYCRRHKLLLIEDLAHCPDNRYLDGPAFGQIGDFVILSFGDSKQIDVVSGGALIVRNKAAAYKVSQPQLIKGYWWLRFTERLQPLLTGWLRQSYRWPALGRYVHAFLLKSGLLKRASDDGLLEGVGLTPVRARFILEQWRNLPADKERRARLMNIYSSAFKEKNVLLKKQALVRYPVLLTSSDARDPLLRKLASNGFHLKDHWYDSAVYPNRFAEVSAYKPGSCPQKEEINGRVINLPLHRNISEKRACELAQLIVSFKTSGKCEWKAAERKTDWQTFLKVNPTWAENCLQSFNWGLSHEKAGGQAFQRVLWDGNRPIAGYIALLETGRFQRFLAIAGGPSLDWENQSVLRSFKEDVSALARKNRCLFVRIRPQALDSKKMRQALRRIKFSSAPWSLSVELAGILDLSLSDKDIRRKFNKSLRHKIRDATGDKDIKINVSRRLKDATLFSKLHQEHARRRRYNAFSERKLVNQFKAFATDDEVLLYFARRKGKILAVNMVFFFGREASHLFGISTKLGQKYSCTPLLHLEAIAEARRRGLQIYNLWGVVGANKIKHRYYGLSQFKRGFGIEDYQYVPAHDLVIKRWSYIPLWIYLTLLRKYRRL